MVDESVDRPEIGRFHVPMTGCNPGKLGSDGATSPTVGPSQSAVRDGAGLGRDCQIVRHLLYLPWLSHGGVAQ
jgi:hypothetical protein